MRSLLPWLTCLLLSLPALAADEEGSQADEAAAPAGEVQEPQAQEGGVEQAPPGEANLIQQLAGALRAKVLDKMEEKIVAKQEAQMDRLSTGLSIFAMLGLLLLFMPIFLARRYPGKLWLLIRYSALSAILFVVAVNLFSGVLLILRGAQAELGRSTNPQLAIVEAAFNTLENKGSEFAAIGPSLIEPTLKQLTDDSEEPLPVLLLENTRAFKKDVDVFIAIASFFKSVNWILGYLPMLLTLIAVALFALATKPTLLEIIRLPQRAAEGQQGLVKQVLVSTLKRIGRELLATLATIGVLIFVTLMGGGLLTRAIEPAVEGFMGYLALCVIYLQSAPDVSSLLIYASLGGTIFFLVLNLAAVVVPSGLYLGKAQKIFQARVHEKVPLRQHRVFWFWGTAALLGSMVFPAVFIAAGEPLVELLVEKSFNPQAPSWGLLLVSGPVLLIVLFAAAFWAIRLFKGVAYLARYKIAPVPAVALGVSRASTAQPRRPPLSPSGVEGPVQLQPLRPATTAPTRRQTLS
jgi:hypothetical protein